MITQRSAAEGKAVTIAKVRARRSLAAAFASFSALFPATSHAGGFLADRFGSDHGNPMTGNPFAVYFNPAALGGMGGTQITVDGAIAYRTVDFQRSTQALSPGSGQRAGDPVYRDANTGDARLSNLLFSPYFGAASDFGTTFVAVGFASYVPFGGQESWDQNGKYASNAPPGAQGAVDGVQRWDSIRGETRSWYNTLALTGTIPGVRLSFGVSASYIQHSLSTVRARDAKGEDDVRGPQDQLLEGRALLDVQGHGMGVAFGVYWEPLEDRSVRLGASYTSQPNFGQMRLSGTLDYQFGNIKTAQHNAVDFLQTYPDVFRIGGAWRAWDHAEVRLDFELARWSFFKRQCVVAPGAGCHLYTNGAVNTQLEAPNDVLLAIPRYWNDTVGARASISSFVTDSTEVFGSFGFDTSAVPLRTMDPSFPDSLKLLGSIGVRWAPSKTFLVGTSYNHVYYFPIDTKGESILSNRQIPSRSPSEDGHYNVQLLFVDVNATVRF